MPLSSDLPESTRREFERRPLLLKGLALSVALHVAILALWPEAAAPPRARVVLLYPELLRPAQVEPVRMVPDPEPEGGSAAGAPAAQAEAPAEAAAPSIVPPVTASAPETGPISATPRPVARTLPPPARAARPPATAAIGAEGAGGTTSGEGGGSGAGTGPGTAPGSGAGAGAGGAPAVVAEPDVSPRLVTFPLPINTPETERGEIRGRARVEVVVDERGRVVDARITERLRLRRGDREEAVDDFPAAVDASVLEAARRLRFRPARLAGAPVRAVASVTLSVGV